MLDVLEQKGKLTDRATLTYAIQGGGGEVASTHIRLIREKYPEAKIVISEADNDKAQERAAKVAIEYGAKVVQGDEIFTQKDSIVTLSGPPGQLTDEHLALMQEAGVVGVSGPGNCYFPPYKEKEMSEKFHKADIL